MPARRRPATLKRPADRVGPGVQTPVSNRVDLGSLITSIATAFEASRRESMDTYDGTTEVREWLERYEKHGKLSGWPPNKYSVELCHYLRGVALMWYQATDQHQAVDELEWTRAKDLFIKAFRSPTYELDLQKEAHADLKPGDDLMLFFERRRLVCARLKMNEVDTVSNIIASLSPQLYDKLARKNIRSIDVLRDKLRLLDSDVDRVDLASSGDDWRRSERST